LLCQDSCGSNGVGGTVVPAQLFPQHSCSRWHSCSQYGMRHEGICEIVPCDHEGYPAASPYGSDYEQLMDFLTNTHDQNNTSLWTKMETWAGTKPTPPNSP
ncbi:MAG: hypothetical protein WCO86_06215, partial [Planctomycetota bacterium]